MYTNKKKIKINILDENNPIVQEVNYRNSNNILRNDFIYIDTKNGLTSKCNSNNEYSKLTVRNLNDRFIENISVVERKIFAVVNGGTPLEGVRLDSELVKRENKEGQMVDIECNVVKCDPPSEQLITLSLIKSQIYDALFSFFRDEFKNKKSNETIVENIINSLQESKIQPTLKSSDEEDMVNEDAESLAYLTYCSPEKLFGNLDNICKGFDFDEFLIGFKETMMLTLEALEKAPTGNGIKSDLMGANFYFSMLDSLNKVAKGGILTTPKMDLKRFDYENPLQYTEYEKKKILNIERQL